VCLALARSLGLPSAATEVVRFEDQVAIAVERYDRRRSGAKVTRIHQEDICQALAVHPARKYESEGGPGVRDVVELLRSASTGAKVDEGVFLDAVGVAWLVGGTDAELCAEVLAS
jgi:serine/threonine-protein kinase HipA